jgi:threonine aldolase
MTVSHPESAQHAETGSFPRYINIRSDTQTLPTPEMRRAIAEAELGDDTYGEDPTVNRLQEMAAEMTGMEAALLVLSGTMGNLIALMTLAQPGDEVLLDLDSHIFYYEVGNIANIAGLMPMPVPCPEGMMDSHALREAIRSPNLHYPRPKVLCLENTHNRSGGRVLPLELHNELCEVAHDHGLKVHIDGARIFNAALAAGVPVSAYMEKADSLMFCLSKGLGCPLGSMLCGSKEFIAEADRNRKRLGGGMRQAGIIAAAGIHALENNVQRLLDDHKSARRLAEGMNQIPGLYVDMHTVESNMIYLDHRKSGLSNREFLTLLEQHGVLASPRPPYQVRMVTSYHHTPEIIEEILRRTRVAMESRL